MKVLVTGATGFLGFRTCELLREKGWKITASGRNLEKGKLLQDAGFEFMLVNHQGCKLRCLPWLILHNLLSPLATRLVKKFKL